MLHRHVSSRIIARTCSSRRFASTLLAELEERGFIAQTTRPHELQRALESSSQTVYSGIDPTAPALHIGHLFPLMCLLHFELHQHKTIPLIGGATGLVGDPSGRTKERSVADVEQVQQNVVSLTSGIRHFFKRAFHYASSRGFSELEREVEVKNNLVWYENFKMLDFLRVVGSNARVNIMLSRDSVKTRLDSSQGMSFTEFTYQLLQAYDFYYLHKNFACHIQVGGSDQWGNIVAGVELINKLSSESASPTPEPFGVTTPLLTTASGQKFGKSAGNAIWMQKDLTSVFDFYQYFIKVEDADVEKLLKAFTLLPLDVIESVIEEHQIAPENRIAQKRLAAEVTEMIHGRELMERAIVTSNALFPTTRERQYDATTILQALDDDARLFYCPANTLFSTSVAKLAAQYGLAASNGAAKTLANQKGLYFNHRVAEATYIATPNDLLDGRLLILRAGKDKTIVLALEERE